MFTGKEMKFGSKAHLFPRRVLHMDFERWINGGRQPSRQWIERVVNTGTAWVLRKHG